MLALSLILASGVGKTQFLLLLLLNAQLLPPLGFAQSALYISTEAPLQTARLNQILKSHPHFLSLGASQKPSLSRILSIQTPDLESQEHILQYQLPVAIRRQNIGLVVIDSVAANYRAEFDRAGVKHGGAAMAERSTQLLRLGNLLRQVARIHDVAIVVANQVADRFASSSDSGVMHRQASISKQEANVTLGHSQKDVTPPSTPYTASQTDFEPLALDHQQRWFTGWGDEPSHRHDPKSYKTPSLGLVWTNQIAARIALVKEPLYPRVEGGVGHSKPDTTGWKRQMKVVFAPWAPPTTIVSGPTAAGVSFEITEAGVRAAMQQPSTT